jgi:hypothetical protein
MRGVYSVANISGRNLLFCTVWRVSSVWQGELPDRAYNGCVFRFGMVLGMARRLDFGWCLSSHDSTTQNVEDKFLKEDGYRPQAQRWKRTSSAASLLSPLALSVWRYVKRSNSDGHVQVMKGCTERRVVSLFILHPDVFRYEDGWSQRGPGRFGGKVKHLSILGSEPSIS